MDSTTGMFHCDLWGFILCYNKIKVWSQGMCGWKKWKQMKFFKCFYTFGSVMLSFFFLQTSHLAWFINSLILSGVHLQKIQRTKHKVFLKFAFIFNFFFPLSVLFDKLCCLFVADADAKKKMKKVTKSRLINVRTGFVGAPIKLVLLNMSFVSSS